MTLTNLNVYKINESDFLFSVFNCRKNNLLKMYFQTIKQDVLPFIN